MAAQKGHVASSTYSIFVGGVPRAVTETHLMQHFSQFGEVTAKIINKKSSTKKKQGKVTAPNTTKCIYIIQTSQKTTYEAILGLKQQSLLGRNIICSPYKTGSALGQHNLDWNSRRVMVKNVPREVPESEVRSLLEGQGGRLDNFYRYKSERKSDSASARKWSTYSAMYSSAEHAAQAVRAGKVTTSTGYWFTIESFDNNFASKSAPEIPSGNKTKSEVQTISFKKPSNQPNKQLAKSFLATSKTIYSQTSIQAGPAQLVEEKSSLTFSFKPTSGEQPADNSCVEAWQCYCAKPTTQAYRTYRRELVHVEANIQIEIRQPLRLPSYLGRQ